MHVQTEREDVCVCLCARVCMHMCFCMRKTQTNLFSEEMSRRQAKICMMLCLGVGSELVKDMMRVKARVRFSMYGLGKRSVLCL